jgi:ABC-type uncharacterized transport system permease subunit
MLLIYPTIAYLLTLMMIVIHNRRMVAHHDQQEAQREITLTSKKHQLWIQLFILILLVLHGVACYQDIFTPEGIVFGFAQALSLMAWVAITLYWIEGWFFTLNGMLPLILGLAMIFSFLPVVFSGAIISTKAVHSPGFKLHFITANIAYGIMFLAALQAILMTMQDRSLRSKQQQDTSSWMGIFVFGRSSRLLEQLPPLLIMERVMFNIIGIGFCLLTIAVFSGIFFSQSLFGRPLIIDHKTIFALLSWAMFGGLLHAHWRVGLRGAEASKWVLGSFAVLVLAYIGSRFVLEVILHRL